MNPSTRSFHLSCMGLLDPLTPRAALASQLLGLIDADSIHNVLVSTPADPIPIMPAGLSLADALRLDSALLALGVRCCVLRVDSHEPHLAHAFLDQREAGRRHTRLPVTPIDQRVLRDRRHLPPSPPLSPRSTPS